MNSQMDVPGATPPRKGKRAWIWRVAVAGVAMVGGFVACQAFGGHPDGDVDVTGQVASPLCIGQCLPDPGSMPVAQTDCQLAESLDRLMVVSFDDTDTNTGLPIALDMYSYTDGTARPILSEFSTSPTTFAFACEGFQPRTRLSDLPCGANVMHPVSAQQATPSNSVLHIQGGYQPGNDTLGPVCGDPLTIEPVPFRGYGGGLGVALAKLNNRDQFNQPGNGVTARNGADNANRGYCMTRNMGAGTRPDVCPPLDAGYAVSVATLDVSTYDGISFWARRGPNGQIGVHVGIGDQNTDDDISYLEYKVDPSAPRRCERLRACSCGNHRPCQYEDPEPCQFPNCGEPPNQMGNPAGQAENTALGPCLTVTPNNAPGGKGWYCFPFDKVSAGEISLNGQSATSFCAPLGQAITDENVATQCNVPYPAYPNDSPDGGYVNSPCGAGTPGAGLAGDRQFWGKPCTPFEWQNGVGGAYCFDPAHDPPPADPTQQCGDHWISTVDLSTDWKFYRVPFTDLRQQGFAKKFEQIDLHAVSVVRLTWDAGWFDYWFDDIAFYRNPKN